MNEHEENYEMTEDDLKEYYYYLNELGNKFYCLRHIDSNIYSSICEGRETIARALNRIGEVLRLRDKARDPIHGKLIKKMSWDNDGFTGIKVKIETNDDYVLTYSLGADGSLVYIKTTDVG